MSGTVVPIDLNKNPEVAALVADLAPGSKVYGCFTIKDKDDQSLNLRIRSMAGSCDELKDSDSEDEEDDDEDSDQSPEGEEAEEPTKEEPVARKMARMMESNASDGY